MKKRAKKLNPAKKSPAPEYATLEGHRNLAREVEEARGSIRALATRVLVLETQPRRTHERVIEQLPPSTLKVERYDDTEKNRADSDKDQVTKIAWSAGFQQGWEACLAQNGLKP